MLVVKLVAGPAEKLDGGARECVGELEDVLDIFLRDAEAGIVEEGLDGGGRRGGDDFAEESDFGEDVRVVSVGSEDW